MKYTKVNFMEKSHIDNEEEIVLIINRSDSSTILMDVVVSVVEVPVRILNLEAMSSSRW